MNTAPFEIIGYPVDVYKAPVGTPFPDVAVAPAEPWMLIGSSGNLDYDRDAGVTVEHRQTVNSHRALGDTGTRKVFRVEEDLITRFTLNDLTPEQYAIGLNDNVVTAESGTRSVGLSRGAFVATQALLIRGNWSPLGATGQMQYELPITAQQGSPSVVYKNGIAAGIALEFMSIVDTTQPPDERFGRLVVQEEPT